MTNALVPKCSPCSICMVECSLMADVRAIAAWRTSACMVERRGVGVYQNGLAWLLSQPAHIIAHAGYPAATPHGIHRAIIILKERGIDIAFPLAIK